jgi:hypothetical protein
MVYMTPAGSVLSCSNPFGHKFRCSKGDKQGKEPVSHDKSMAKTLLACKPTAASSQHQLTQPAFPAVQISRTASCQSQQPRSKLHPAKRKAFDLRSVIRHAREGWSFPVE